MRMSRDKSWVLLAFSFVLMVSAVTLVLTVSSQTRAHGDDHAGVETSGGEVVVLYMKNFRFHFDPAATTVDGVELLNEDPLKIKIPSGAKVIWENRDTMQHNVMHATAENMKEVHGKSAFHSPEFLNPGDKFAYVFEKDGEYPILCMVGGHYLAGMVGDIVVGKGGDIDQTFAMFVNQHRDDDHEHDE